MDPGPDANEEDRNKLESLVKDAFIAWQVNVGRQISKEEGTRSGIDVTPNDLCRVGWGQSKAEMKAALKERGVKGTSSSKFELRNALQRWSNENEKPIEPPYMQSTQFTTDTLKKAVRNVAIPSKPTCEDLETAFLSYEGNMALIDDKEECFMCIAPFTSDSQATACEDSCGAGDAFPTCKECVSKLCGCRKDKHAEACGAGSMQRFYRDPEEGGYSMV